MDEAIVRERASEISRILGNCKKFLHQGNVYACLSAFKEALEKMLVTRMLPADENELKEAVNDFQRQLMTSAAFKNTFGPVTFHDDDIQSSLAFVRQMVHVSEEALAESLAGGQESQENRALMIMRLIDKGEHEKAKALIGKNEDLLNFILHTYNAAGIQAPGGSTNITGTPIVSQVGNCNYTVNDGYVQQLIGLINQARKDAGIPEMTVNQQLMNAAQGHSLDMACNNFLAHSGSDGSWIGNRLINAVYTSPYYMEIIAIGLPQDAMNQWRNDKDHWDMVLNSGLTEFGVGYVYSKFAAFGGYWTVDMGGP